MKMLLLALSTVILFCGQSYSQVSTESSRVPDSTVIRPKGWKLPAFRTTNELIASSEINGVTVKEYKAEIRDSTPFEMEFYYVPQAGTVELGNNTVVVYKILELRVRDRTFAYRISYNPANLGDGIVRVDGAVISYYYVDKDGTGKFTERYPSTTLREIPKWVKDLK